MLGKLLDGRYQVLQVLGGGGFGQTYIAQDRHRPGNPKCVVKHLRPVTHNPEFITTAWRLFASEAETLEKLGHHDQIPRLLAYFEDNQEFFLVQEFIEGHTLKEELIPGRRWREEQVIQLLQQVLHVLEFVHSYNVIHRDIKPNNIIRRQQDSKLVLIDFGAVKQIQTQMLTAVSQMEMTIAIGTPGYMSTEQGRGRPRPNSDIYSLGIIGIQALTGWYPSQFEEAPNTGEILWQHQAQVSPELGSILSMMVLHHFKERYQTAREVLQAIAQLGTVTRSQSTQQAIATQLPTPSIQQPQSSQSQPISSPPTGSILSPEQYNRLKNILVEIVGPIAPTFLRQIAASTFSREELIDKLALHLPSRQQPEFKQKANFLLTEPTARSAQVRSDSLASQQTPPAISTSFVSQCERDLAEIIGPIASFLVQKTVKSSPQISRFELVEILAAEIPDPQKASQFKQRLLG